MSSTHTPSSFSTSQLSSSNGGPHQGNNTGAPQALQSASHPSHASGSFTFPGASQYNSRDSDNSHRVNRVEGSGVEANRNSTLPQSGLSYQERPQYVVNINLIDSWSDNQVSVRAPTDAFQPGREIVPPNITFQVNPVRIIPDVQALTRIGAERASSTSYPQDYGLAPSASMAQGASVPRPPPVPDIAMVNSSARVSRDSISFPNTNVWAISHVGKPPLTFPFTQSTIGNGHLAPTLHTVTAHSVDVDMGWEGGHYRPSLYQRNANNVTVPTHTVNPTQNPQGGFNFSQRGPQPTAVPFPGSQRYAQPHHNAIIAQPHPVLAQPFRAQSSSAMTVLPTWTTLAVPPLSSPQNIKKETEEESDPTRPHKRRAPTASTVSATSHDESLSNPSIPNWYSILSALPADDPRKKGPPVTVELGPRGTLSSYTCLYSGPGSKTGGDKCNETITTNCTRNWMRHVGTHAAEEERMINSGALQPEEVHALLWVRKNAFLCPVEGCGFSAEDWRVDGIRQAHLKQCHGVESEKRRRGEKTNE